MVSVPVSEHSGRSCRPSGVAEQAVGQQSAGDDPLEGGPHGGAITGHQPPVVRQVTPAPGLLVDPIPDDPEPVIGLVMQADLQPRRRALGDDHRPVAGFQGDHSPEPRHELGEEPRFVGLRDRDPAGRDQLPQLLGQRPVQPGEDHPAGRVDRPVPPTDQAVRRLADQPHAGRVQHVAVQPDGRRHGQGRCPGHVDRHPGGLTRDLDVTGALAAATELDARFRRPFQQIPDAGTDLTVRRDPGRRRVPRGPAALGLGDRAQGLQLFGLVLAGVLRVPQVAPGHPGGHPPTLGVQLHRPDPDLRRAEQVLRLVRPRSRIADPAGCARAPDADRPPAVCRAAGSAIVPRRRAALAVSSSTADGGRGAGDRDARDGGQQMLQQHRDAVLAVGLHRAVAAALEVLHLAADQAEPNVRLVRPGSGADARWRRARPAARPAGRGSNRRRRCRGPGSAWPTRRATPDRSRAPGRRRAARRRVARCFRPSSGPSVRLLSFGSPIRPATPTIELLSSGL